jgi:hypothetical protein
LAKGVHSLLAVATDTAGNTSSSALVQITVTNAARYTLGPGPFTVENLGGGISGNSIDCTALFVISNHTHFICDYIANYAVQPLQILDVDLSQGTARLTNGAVGRAAAYGYVLYTNNLVYLATGEASGLSTTNEGFLMSYEPITGATRTIAQLSQYAPECEQIGDDGWIYIGEFQQGFVDRYYPPTDTFQTLGSFESPTDYANGKVGVYGYSIGADTRYMYVGLGESPWYLAIYDTQRTNTTWYWQTNIDTIGLVYHGTNGCWYYQREGPTVTNSGGVAWYQLTNGVPVPLALQPSGGLFVECSGLSASNVVRGVTYGYLFGYSVNLDYAVPNSINNNPLIVSWQRNGATSWQSVAVTNGFVVSPYTIFRLYPWDSTHLIGFGFVYGPVFLYNVITNQSTASGPPPNINVYDMLFEPGSPPEVAYFAGYGTTILRYNPTLPWTLFTSTTNRFGANINPYQIGLVIGEHNYFSAFGSDGMVYAAADDSRKGTWGDLGWYDPTTGTNGFLTITNDANSAPEDLKRALGGTKLVYLTTSSTNLYIFDVATKTITSIIPISLPGVTALDKVVEVSPGIMFGAAGNTLYEINITNGVVISTTNLPTVNSVADTAFVANTAQYNHRLVLGPDGYIWLPVNQLYGIQHGTDIYRINPADLSMTDLIWLGQYNTNATGLMFNGGDMYLYGRTNLCRIQGVLVTTVTTVTTPPPPDGLRLLQ